MKATDLFDQHDLDVLSRAVAPSRRADSQSQVLLNDVVLKRSKNVL